MTTEELLWNAAFEREDNNHSDGYNYNEEWNMERYYKHKELTERFGDYLKTAG